MKQFLCVGAVVVFVLLILGLPACAGPTAEPGKQLQKQSPPPAGSSSAPTGQIVQDSAGNHFPSRPLPENKHSADKRRLAGTQWRKTSEDSSPGAGQKAPRAHPVSQPEAPSKRSARSFEKWTQGASPASAGQHSPLQIAQAPQSSPAATPPAPPAPPAPSAAAPPLPPGAPVAASGAAPSVEASDSLLPAEAARRTTNAAVVIAAVLSILAIFIAYLTRKPPAEKDD